MLRHNVVWNALKTALGKFPPSQINTPPIGISKRNITIIPCVTLRHVIQAGYQEVVNSIYFFTIPIENNMLTQAVQTKRLGLWHGLI